jgi:Family of unknown function (DUF5329)
MSLTYANNHILIGGPSYMQQAINEEQKINQLILFVEKTDAKFIRNDVEYSGVDAAKHLRMKREKAGSKIKTAKDFIDLIASKSSVSGKPYQMKYKNGSIINVRDILYYELKKIEAKQVGMHKGIKLTKSPAC